MVTCCNSALLCKLIQRFGECQYNMSRGGKAPFSVLFHSSPLIQQIQRKGTGFSLACKQFISSADDKGETWNTLNTFVCTGNQEVNSPRSNRDINAAKRGHCVYDEGASCLTNYSSYRLNIIEDSAGSFAVDHCHMCDGWIFCQQFCNMGCIWNLVIGLCIVKIRNLGMITNLSHSFSVCTIGADQYLVLISNYTGKDTFHTECSASLHQNSSIIILGNLC